MPAIINNRLFSLIDELFDGRIGTPATIDGERTYTRRFLVVVKQKLLGPEVIANAPGIPNLLSSYVLPFRAEYDLLALAIKKTARQMDNDDWQRWVVEVEYSTRMPAGGPRDNPAHPENDPPEIKISYETSQEAPLYDFDGTPFQNSAGVPYSPPPTFERAYPVLSITRNELSFDLSKADYYCYRLNHASFLGYPRGCAMCMPIEAEQKYRGNLRYWRTHTRIRFRLRFVDDATGEKGFTVPVPYRPPANDAEISSGINLLNAFGGQGGGPDKDLLIQQGFEVDTWQPRLLDQGLVERTINTGQDKDTRPTRLSPIVDDENHPVTHPYLLNGQGGKQTLRDAKGNLFAIYRVYNYYRYADLIALLVKGVGIEAGPVTIVK